MTGRILTVNTGSSSVKLAAFDAPAEPVVRKALDAEDDPAAHLGEVTGGTHPAVVVHRVVLGKGRSAPARVDDALLSELEECIPLAPNHNPLALAWIRAALSVWPAVPQLVAFDTAFFAGLPPKAATYALPRELSRRYGLRRHGFHGLAHESMWRTFLALGRPESSRVVTLQLGSGCSAAAIRAGAPVDTSMGFTPLEGLVMATRSGDVDPGLLLWLLREAGHDADELEKLLSARSGVLGLAGSSDLRQVLASEDADAKLAVDVFAWRLRKYVGAYLAALGGADAILLGGGIGEHLPRIRAEALRDFAWAGIVLDEEANQRATSGTRPIHAAASDVEIWTVAVDEERLLADLGRSFLGSVSGS